MAGIDLPAGSYFFDYRAMQPMEPTLVMPSEGGHRAPDTRNTVCWMDHLVMEGGESEKITFRAPRTGGDYIILVRGMSDQGGILSVATQFTVE
jgi:hypothetical protein